MTRPLYEIRNLLHRYGERTVLEEDGLDLYPETITGIAGPNGSGKSTLINILALIVKPTRGTLAFMGRNVSLFSVHARGQIAALTQDPALLKRNVAANVAYGPRVLNDRENLDRRVTEALDAVGLDPAVFAGRNVRALSGGEARRVALAARLVLKPKLLLLDEPTAHVDEHSSAMIRQAVLQARQRWKTAFLISSHDREWLDSFSDQTLTAFHGRLFREERVNILPGPWKQDGDLWFRTGESEPGTGMPVPAPPDPGRDAAVLPASALRVVASGEPVPEPWIRFPVVLAGTGLSRTRDCLLLALEAGDTRLVAMVGEDEWKNIRPGQTCVACYDPSRLMFR